MVTLEITAVSRKLKPERTTKNYKLNKVLREGCTGTAQSE
jgi:hypothetical protein